MAVKSDIFLFSNRSKNLKCMFRAQSGSVLISFTAVENDDSYHATSKANKIAL